MEYCQTQGDEEARARLLAAAKALVLKGDNSFSVSALCAEAGVDRDAFHAHFSGKTALMAALMQTLGTPESAVTDAAAESLGERDEGSKKESCRNHAWTRPHEIPSC